MANGLNSHGRLLAFLQRVRFGLAALSIAMGVWGSACAGTDAGLAEDLEADDVAVSQEALIKPSAVASTATAGTVKPPKGGGTVVYFQCGWDPKSLSAQCTCHGDADCNRMFTSGFCGANASCDSGNDSCTCDLKL